MGPAREPRIVVPEASGPLRHRPPARRRPVAACAIAVIGAHALLHTSEPEAVRAVFRDVFGWPHVDDGDGWPIFALPPAELGVHTAEGPSYEAGVRHEVSLMCDDVAATVRDLRAKGLEIVREPEDEGFGITTTLRLPGGLDVVLYEPRHRTAI